MYQCMCMSLARSGRTMSIQFSTLRELASWGNKWDVLDEWPWLLSSWLTIFALISCCEAVTMDDGLHVDGLSRHYTALADEIILQSQDAYVQLRLSSHPDFSGLSHSHISFSQSHCRCKVSPWHAQKAADKQVTEGKRQVGEKISSDWSWRVGVLCRAV